MFEAFPKLTRFSHGWTITEKLDGTNGQIWIVPHDEMNNAHYEGEDLVVPVPEGALDYVDDHFIFAGSRNRFIGLGKKDPHGFGKFVHDNAKALVETLGPGRHFGEWVGKGIGPRGYNLDEKVFALFNVNRWEDVELPNRVTVVPRLADGYMDNPSQRVLDSLNELKEGGSAFAPGFMNPEGIVMHHGPSGTLFKKTFEYDEAGKWAENQERKNAATS